MKGDFSRLTFDPTRHYSAVLMQQGRVQLDADWNEQGAIQRHRVETEARDVVGDGAPLHAAGFGISVETRDPNAGPQVFVGAGRYYVDGLLCENEAECAFGQQPDGADAADALKLLEAAQASAGLVYLDVWERHVTALDDPLLREKALGGPDTATRAQTIWQVKVLPVALHLPDPQEIAKLQQERARVQQKLAEAEAARATDAVEELRAILAEIDAKLAHLGDAPDCDTSFPEWDALVALRGASLNARTSPPQAAADACLVPPSHGYLGLENQLYRVEIHQPGPLGRATFKWSRDNGSVVTAIEELSGQVATVASLGPDDVLGFANGQWVEALDDRLELSGRPGTLAQIQVEPATRRVTLSVAPGGLDLARHARLRRWDGPGEQSTQPPPDGDGWIALEDGIEVQFGPGEYRTGDYWLIPARTATGEVEWPPFEVPNVDPVAQPPRGVRHHYARLALLQRDPSGAWQVQDCRRLFRPLTEIAPALPAIHVVGISWDNDDLLPVDRFANAGLQLELDGQPNLASLGPASVVVALEAPFGDGDPLAQPDLIVLLDGTITTAGQVVRWVPNQAELQQLARAFRNPVRARLTLKGRVIWSDEGSVRRYLDGQAFGRPDVRADRQTPRTALVLPSGDGARGSDFESWFYLTGPLTTLHVVNVRFATMPTTTPAPIPPGGGQTSSAGVIAVPPVPPNVTFKAGEKVNAIEVTFSRPVQRDPFVQPTLRPVQVRFADGHDTVAAIGLVSETVARLFLRDPSSFGPGQYVLRVAGADANGAAVVHAVDDSSALDGDFDGQPGGDFVLPFSVT